MDRDVKNQPYLVSMIECNLEVCALLSVILVLFWQIFHVAAFVWTPYKM